MVGTIEQQRCRQAKSWLTDCLADGLGCVLCPVSGEGSKLPALFFGLAALLLFSGCEKLVGFAKDQNSRESIVASNAHYNNNTPAFGAETLDVSHPIETVTSEQQALEAFFRARYLLAKGHSSAHQPEARGHYVQAKVLFEKSLKFFIPDLQAMTFGKNPIHASANWHFFRSLHDYWAKACVLSGYSTDVERIEENAKDAWALAVIHEITKNNDQRGRMRVIAESFQLVKRGLVSQLKHCENSPAPSRPDSLKAQAQATHAPPPVEKLIDDVKIAEEFKWRDSELERMRKNAEERQAQELDDLKFARHSNKPHLFTGDPANGKVNSIDVQR